MSKISLRHTGCPTGVSILRLPAVKNRVSLSRSSIYAGIKKGTFPSPIKLGERAVGWLDWEIDDFLTARTKASCNEAAA
ncbi:MAG: AlpA family phage regulatory protein [Pseudomonadota bacterium]